MSTPAEDVTRLRNVRDVGGLPLDGGGTTRRGVLLRADAPRAGDVAPADLAWPPRLVIDLRSPDETEDVHPLAGDAAVHVLPLSAHAAVDGLARAGGAGLGGLYTSIVGTAGPLIARTAELVADAPAPVLVHCTAGKDRTGLVVALLLGAVGVERDAIVADYVATQANMAGVVARIASGPVRADGRDWPAFLATVAPEVLTAPAERIAAVLDGVDAEGGAGAWLRAQGVAPETLERLRERLTG